MLIVLIIGGIMLGVVAAAEALGIAVPDTMLLAFVIHRTAPLRALSSFLIGMVQMTGTTCSFRPLGRAQSFNGVYPHPATVGAPVPTISGNPLVVLPT